MESLLQDLRFGLKLLLKDKGFALTALATLALCIGANAAVFAIIHSVVLKPLPLPEPDRILIMYNSYPNAGVKRASNGVPDYYDRVRVATAFEELALYNSQGLTVGEKNSVQQLDSMGITPSLFRLLRVKPLLGRNFLEEEAEIGNQRKVILSYALWQELYGGDGSVIGKDLRIYGNPHTIVGVMPKGFFFLDPKVRLWRPLAFTPEQKQAYHSNSWEMIGRLKTGAALQQAQAQIDALNRANLDRLPELKPLLINAGFHTEVHRLQDEIVRDIKGTLYLLWGGVLFVLLIGAVNIANLALARSSVRMKELATRFALGAGRWRVTRQLVTESVLLTCCSALIGLLLGWWGLKLLGALRLNQIPRGSEIAMDGTAVSFILGLAVFVGAAIGVIPVIHAQRIDLTSVFRTEGRTGTTGRGARILRNALVVSQVAFALILLAGAGLLLESFRRVLAVKPGFSYENVLTGTVALPTVHYKDDAALRSFTDRALEKVRALPGILGAGATDCIPFGDNSSDSVILAEGYTMKPGESVVSPNQIVVTPGYLEAMRVPLLEGRLFDARDTADSPKVVIIDQRLARKFWPNASPIGKRMWRPNSPQDLVQPGKDVSWYTVIGVVGSIKLRALVDPDERVGIYYFPVNQSPRDYLTFAIRTAGNPTSLTRPLANAIREVDAELPMFGVHTMDERISDSLITRRSPMLVSMGFGLVALFLAAVGIYGVLAYMVAQRTKEIGIRMALGGSTKKIFRLVLGEGLLLLGAGFVIGLAGTVVLSRYLAAELFGIRPLDPFVLASVASILAAVALVASVLPAQRATRVDPIVALRQE
jgi:predicted permease